MTVPLRSPLAYRPWPHLGEIAHRRLRFILIRTKARIYSIGAATQSAFTLFRNESASLYHCRLIILLISNNVTNRCNQHFFGTKQAFVCPEAKETTWLPTPEVVNTASTAVCVLLSLLPVNCLKLVQVCVKNMITFILLLTNILTAKVKLILFCKYLRQGYEDLKIQKGHFLLFFNFVSQNK